MKATVFILFALLLADGAAEAAAYTKSRGVVNPAVKAKILRQLNSFRREYGAPDLMWSTRLATSAQSWTNQCIWAHDIPTLQALNYGENLSLTPGPWRTAIDLWTREAASYDFSSPGYAPDTGHFTQVVWNATVSVGCAETDCSTALANNIWSCRFHPPGNYLGTFENNVFAPGSKISGR